MIRETLFKPELPPTGRTLQPDWSVTF